VILTLSAISRPNESLALALRALLIHCYEIWCIMSENGDFHLSGLCHSSMVMSVNGDLHLSGLCHSSMVVSVNWDLHSSGPGHSSMVMPMDGNPHSSGRGHSSIVVKFPVSWYHWVNRDFVELSPASPTSLGWKPRLVRPSMLSYWWGYLDLFFVPIGGARST
jgi:hypothetical protein